MMILIADGSQIPILILITQKSAEKVAFILSGWEPMSYF